MRNEETEVERTFCVQVRMAKDALQRSEESAELLAEKSMVAEQEAMLLQQKAR